MSPEATAALYAVGAWVRSLALADAFPTVAGFVVAVWLLRGQKDYAPRSLGKVLFYGALGYLAALAIQALAIRG